jgi:hypothetical protein
MVKYHSMVFKMSNTTLKSAPIFSQVTLQHGPIGVLGRTILVAEQLCEQQGVTLSFVTPSDYLHINQSNGDTWLPLLRLFDNRFNNLTSHNSLFIVGHNNRGDVVACQAARFYDWSTTNCADEIESLRMFYADPKADSLPGEGYRVSSRAARGTSGRAVFSGGAWYRKDMRGMGLVEWLPRLSRALAMGLWDTSTTITFMSEANVQKGVFPRNGYRNIEWAVQMQNTAMGSLKSAFVWTKDDEMVDDLQLFLDRQISADRVVKGYARAK